MLRRLLLATIGALAATPAFAEDAGPIDVEAYRLVLTLDRATKGVAGEEAIRVRFRQPGREIGFTDNALEITAATADGRPVDVRRGGGRLSFVLPAARQAGARVSLRVSFRGTPRRGLTFEPSLAYTGYFTCDWMICDQDRPGDRATLDLDVRDPEGGRTPRGRAGAGRAAPAYLYGFVAGRFESADIPGGQGLQALSGERSAAELRTLFAPTPDMARFFAEKAGVPLRRGYWQLLSRASAAQEGAGFAVVGEPELLPILPTPDEDWVIAHELAHQWWGVLVGCETWREMWLNEGFATFMTAAWKEHRWGRAAYDREMALARRRLAASAAVGFDKPLAWSGTYPSLGVRRGVVYSKGALFLDAVRTRLGDRLFWRAIRTYTRGQAGSTVTGADFERAVEAVAPGRAGDLFRTWVDDDGGR
jgi:aminopeptidase N